MKSRSRGCSLSGLRCGGRTETGLLCLPGLKSGFGLPGLGLSGPADGLFPDGLSGAGLSGCGLFTDGLPGFVPEGLLPDGRDGFLSAGLISACGLLEGFDTELLDCPAGRVDALPEGFAVVPEGRTDALPEGFVAVPDGRVDALPEGFEAGAEGFTVFLSFEPDGREVEEPEGREAEALDDREVEDDLEPPRDCASRSGWKAANANPISIAAKVLADNLIVINFKVNRYGTFAIMHGKNPHLSANNP